MTNKERFIGKHSVDMARNLIGFANSNSCPRWKECVVIKNNDDCFQFKANICVVEIAKWLNSEE